MMMTVTLIINYKIKLNIILIFNMLHRPKKWMPDDEKVSRPTSAPGKQTRSKSRKQKDD